MNFDRQQLKQIVPLLLIGLIGFLVAFSVLAGDKETSGIFWDHDSNSLNTSGLVKDATCKQVEQQLEAKFRNETQKEINCICFLAENREDELADKAVGEEKAELLKEKADLYLITCKRGQQIQQFPVWLVTNPSQPLN